MKGNNNNKQTNNINIPKNTEETNLSQGPAQMEGVMVGWFLDVGALLKEASPRRWVQRQMGALVLFPTPAGG